MSWHPFRDAKTRSAWREELVRRQGGLCALCGHRFAEEGELSEELQIKYAATFDHVIPRSQGGTDDLTNFQLVHAACNLARGDGNGSKAAPSLPRKLRSPARVVAAFTAPIEATFPAHESEAQALTEASQTSSE